MISTPPLTPNPRQKFYRGTVVVMDDEENMCKILTKIFNLEGYHVTTFTRPENGLEYVRRYHPDLVLSDIKMPTMSGMEVLSKIKQEAANIQVIMMTAYGSIEGAIEAMKVGAFDYVTKPFNTDELILKIQKAIETKRLKEENLSLSDQVRRDLAGVNLLGSSQPMDKVRAMIERIAPTDSAVLIRGESGTGKELVAKALHNASLRKNNRFVAINCASIPENLLESELFGYEKGAFTGANQRKLGLFELAHGGTLFLDEVGELPLSLQVKLLRVLQEREFQRVGGLTTISVDIRLLAASNRDLKQAISEGQFREDLFYRLNVINLYLPPLRERPEDLDQLVPFFIERFRQKLNKPRVSISDQALATMKTYSWPGNVRELENLIERMVVLLEGQTITLKDIPTDVLYPTLRREAGVGAAGAEGESADYRTAKERFEHDYITDLLRRSNGSISAAARASGISRRNLYEKIEKLGVDLSQFKE
ncbi:MAG: sigma-54 dependent transcriptional regulator [bacterium]